MNLLCITSLCLCGVSAHSCVFYQVAVLIPTLSSRQWRNDKQQQRKVALYAVTPTPPCVFPCKASLPKRHSLNATQRSFGPLSLLFIVTPLIVSLPSRAHHIFFFPSCLARIRILPASSSPRMRFSPSLQHLSSFKGVALSSDTESEAALAPHYLARPRHPSRRMLATWQRLLPSYK